MSKSKYYDTSSVIQVLGCLYSNPSLVSNESYHLREDDFSNNDFHRVMFGVINNLVNTGSEKPSIADVENYLSTKPNSLAIYKANNGGEWIKQASANAEVMNYKYYYDRVKKMTLLRAYDNAGIDIKDIYDVDNIFDPEKKEKQEKMLDDSSIEEISEIIENRVLRIKEEVVYNDSDESCNIGLTARETIEELKEKPLVGNALYDRKLTEIALGARDGTFYLRSAATGVGNI